MNHYTLFNKLITRKVPGYILRLIVKCVYSAKYCVQWGAVILEVSSVNNGVKQGGILSPRYFNVYMEDLSKILIKSKRGCNFGGKIVKYNKYNNNK